MVFDEKIKNLTFWEQPGNIKNETKIKLILLANSINSIDRLVSCFKILTNHFNNIEFFYSLDCTPQDVAEYLANDFIAIHLDGSLDLFFNQIQISPEQNNFVKVVSNSVNKDFLKALPETDFIGFQRHIIEKPTLHTVDTYSLGSSSLGLIKNQHVDLEPILRTSKYLHFDPSVGKKNEWPQVVGSLTTGLSVEDICQIFRNVGSSYQISFLSINSTVFTAGTYEPVESLAIALWYFFEGLESRNFHNDYAVSGFQEFVVNVSEIEESLVFGVNTEDGKWWVRVDESNILVPCSKEDYENATKGLLTDRLFRKLFT